LSALLASKLEADLQVILTNVDGLYTDNPYTNPDAQHIPLIESFQDLQAVQTQGQSKLGRGGMSSKLGAARIAAISGIQTLITSGLKERPLEALLKEEAYSGTLVLPQGAISRKKRWIGASGYHGVIMVNEGARQALVEKHSRRKASLAYYPGFQRTSDPGQTSRHCSWILFTRRVFRKEKNRSRYYHPLSKTQSFYLSQWPNFSPIQT